ncbi:hypothetical protein GCM10017567_27230 [Amycolatopsis bullii]|uniref:Uncharacterized protein n=1 Tax=Amycolatopsis bullii TaxID=941987 RepID=A0ABQ3KAX2_9PSEU|nr:hypothetical protein GCM10017567_27230 [Amycolatopsis bullii]
MRGGRRAITVITAYRLGGVEPRWFQRLGFVGTWREVRSGAYVAAQQLEDCRVVARRFSPNLFKAVDAAEAFLGGGGAELCGRLVEAFGDLAASSQHERSSAEGRSAEGCGAAEGNQHRLTDRVERVGLSLPSHVPDSVGA